MAEMLGLASIAEIPAVIVNVQRGGPSTGIPTKSEQSDLMHALYASHGDTPRVVIACNDVEDSYHATVEAFNIAEEFQVPVIVLSDQSIAQRRETIAAESLEHEVIERRLAHELTDYRRYRYTDDGVSPMTVPGQAGGMYQTNGLEHDEQGRPNSMHIVHERMNEKRFRKLDVIAKKYSKLFTRFGPQKADIGILCWGSSTGPVREAVAQLNAEGIRVAAFVPRLLMPLPLADLEQFIAACDELVVMELSFSKQFYNYLRTQVDLPKNRTHVYARSGGSSLRVCEVIDQVKSRTRVSASRAEVMA
jgi:2-oxoglutarate ferredoxin oxidoreductase subunit alpha